MYNITFAINNHTQQYSVFKIKSKYWKLLKVGAKKVEIRSADTGYNRIFHSIIFTDTNNEFLGLAECGAFTSVPTKRYSLKSSLHDNPDLAAYLKHTSCASTVDFMTITNSKAGFFYIPIWAVTDPKKIETARMAYEQGRR